jgi:hypothetical protein
MDILIRKHDLNLYKFDTRNKNVIKNLEVSDDFIDPIDLEMLKKKHKFDLQNYKQPVPKWMNLAWDAFRIVENHSKSMIFMMPEDARNEDFDEYRRKIDNHISLEIMRVPTCLPTLFFYRIS